jgi:hypothetical protein
VRSPGRPRARVAVHERDVVRGVVPAEDRGQRQTVDLIAREDEREVVEHAHLLERQVAARRRSRLHLRDAGGAAARSGQAHAEHGDGPQWLTWCSSTNSVQPLDAA